MVDLGMVQKTRPAVVLSVGYGANERAVVTYVPRTTAVRGTRFEVTHQARGFEPGVFDAQGIGSIPRPKLVRCVAVLQPEVLNQVEAAVRAWLDLD